MLSILLFPFHLYDSSPPISCPSMSVFTLVQRTLILPWRRHSSRHKEKDIQSPNSSSKDNILFKDTHLKPTLLMSDVKVLHITMKQDRDTGTSAKDSATEIHEADSDSENEYLHRCPKTTGNHARTRVHRVVNWARLSIPNARWTSTQEQELLNARIQLTRCQKAWSSEQEVWLDYVCLPLVERLLVR